MSEVAVILEIFLRKPAVQGSLLLGVVVAVLVARPLAARFGASDGAGLSATLSVLPILVVTLAPAVPIGAPALPSLGAYPGRVRACVAPGSVGSGLATAGGLLNVVLYVPAAIALYRLTHRATRVVLGLAVLSAAVELVQPLIGRSCQAADWIANTSGALAGAALGVLALALLKR